MLFYAMSRRRVSCPQMTQQLWDAVKTIRYQRQTPDVDRIAKYMSRVHNVGLEEVNRQLNYCVRDGLLHMTKRVCNKGAKVGAEIESYNLPGDEVDKDSHDWYCFECHRGGDVISCNTCHRVYHLACIDKEQLPETDVKHKFVCNVCKTINEETMDIKKSNLNRLLRLTLRRLKHWLPMSLTERHVICNASASPFVHERQTSRRSNSELPSTIKWVNDDKDPWRLVFLLYRQMDLQMIGTKTEKNQYENIGEFRADAQTIVHNVVIYHGVNSVVADHARLMLRNCLTDLQELKQCRDCYKVSFKVTNRHWFCKPCRPPHTLVYAKQKGFPYWPAKVMNIDGDQYDVRFFGGTHERAVVEKAFIRPISMNINSLQVKKTSAWTKACEELKKHRERLEKLRLATNNFTEPSPDSSSDSSDDESVVEPSLTVKVKSPAENLVKVKEEDESDISDYSDDEEAPLLKRLKREETEDSSSLPEPDLVPANEIPLASVAAAKRKSPPPEETAPPVKRRRGRPAKSVSQLKPIVRKKMIRKVKIQVSLKSGSRRGRPPGTKNRTFILKQQMIEMQRKLEKEFEEKKKKRDQEREQEEDKEDGEKVEKADIKVEPELASRKLKVETEISSTSIPSLPCKKEEEEMVSSSCQEPQVRSVAVQTKPSSPAPPPPLPPPPEIKPVVEEPPAIDVDKIREEVVAEKDKEIERLRAEHIAELAAIEEKHKLYVTEIKKKQWCYNCEAEAIYHCCWNTAYCSIDCQQLHWQKEHKRVCRRKR